MEINIKIERNQYGSQFAIAGYMTLFQFEARNTIGPQWYFWPAGNYSPVIFDGEEFPMDYFTNLCRAKYFVEFGIDKFPDTVKIVKGKKLLKYAPGSVEAKKK